MSDVPTRTAGDGTPVLDCRGELCPVPVVHLARHLAGAEHDEVLLLVDDPAAEADVPAFCRLRGHRHLSVQDHDSASRVHRVRRVSAPG